MSIEPVSSADKGECFADTPGNALAREDPTFAYKGETRRPGQTLISGMGELHMEILKNRMSRATTSSKVHVGRPRCVSYRETVKKPVKKIQGTCVRQDGRHGPLTPRSRSTSSTRAQPREGPDVSTS